MSKKIKSVEINDGHYVEMMDRLHTVTLIIEELLHNHPINEVHPEINELIDEATTKLAQAYQYIGSMQVITSIKKEE